MCLYSSTVVLFILLHTTSLQFILVIGDRVCIKIMYTYSLEGFYLCEDILIGCDGEDTAQSHDLFHHTLELDTSLLFCLNGERFDSSKNEYQAHQ